MSADVVEDKGTASGHLVVRSTIVSRRVKQTIIKPDWNFAVMGIGLDKEFSGIFHRAFASRVFSPDIVQQMGCKHVERMVLFGPPGCGKSLIARQMGKTLNARKTQSRERSRDPQQICGRV